MYRILAAHDEVCERRLIRRHPTYKKPELLAEASQRSLVMGHHLAARSRQIGAISALHRAGHLQPLCGRLDDR